MALPAASDECISATHHPATEGHLSRLRLVANLTCPCPGKGERPAKDHATWQPICDRCIVITSRLRRGQTVVRCHACSSARRQAGRNQLLALWRDTHRFLTEGVITVSRLIMSTICSLLLALLILVGCVAPMPGVLTGSSTAVPAHEPVPGHLTVVDAVARPAPIAGGNGAVYLTVLNGLAEDVQLLSASSPAANVVELHETVDDGGVMRMVPHPEGFSVPAGGSVEMKPGGKHVMLIAVVQPLEPGDAVELSLAFSNGDSIALTAPVVDMGGAMQAQMPADMHDQGEVGADGATESHEHDASMGADLAARIEQLPIDEISALDELLGKGTVDAESGAAVAALIQALDDPAWPEALQPEIAEIRRLAGELQAALDSDDLAAAAPLATQLHDLLHDLAHHAGSQ